MDYISSESGDDLQEFLSYHNIMTFTTDFVDKLLDITHFVVKFFKAELPMFDSA